MANPNAPKTITTITNAPAVPAPNASGPKVPYVNPKTKAEQEAGRNAISRHAPAQD